MRYAVETVTPGKMVTPGKTVSPGERRHGDVRDLPILHAGECADAATPLGGRPE